MSSRHGRCVVIGANDSALAVWAVAFAFAVPAPACVLALWQRAIAGIFLIAASCYLTFSAVVERAYLIEVRHFPNQPSLKDTILGSFQLAWIPAAIGLFATVTGLLKWPEVLQRTPVP
jgi:hypothetical protein